MINNIKNNAEYLFPYWALKLFYYLRTFRHSGVLFKSNVRLGGNVKIGKGTKIGEYCIISSGVSIGNYCFVNDYVRIDSSVKSIGNYSCISHNAKIGLRPHPKNHFSINPIFYSSVRGYVNKQVYDDRERGDTIIGSDVLVGASAIILSGVVIGDGAIVMPGAVVTKNVAALEIVGGIPARFVGKRNLDHFCSGFLDDWHTKEPEDIMNEFSAFMKSFETRPRAANVRKG